MLSRVTMVFLLLFVLVCGAFAQDAGKVEEILKEIDPWVLTDTAKIMAFIDSTNAVTTEMIESSEFWEPTVRDLSFLLGIDLITSPQVDNTGRLYFSMRLTGEQSALFYSDSPGGWPVQLTPNNWSEEGITISDYAVHPSGDFVIVDTYVHGDEWHDLWYFARNGEFRPLLVSRTLSYYGPYWDEDNPDHFYVVTYDRKVFQIADYNLKTGVLDTLYTEPGIFYPTDYYKGKMPIIRSYSGFEQQLGIYDVAANTITNISDTAMFESATFTMDGKIVTRTSAMSNEDEFLKFCLIDPARPNEFKVINMVLEIEIFFRSRVHCNINCPDFNF